MRIEGRNALIVLAMFLFVTLLVSCMVLVAGPSDDDLAAMQKPQQEEQETPDIPLPPVEEKPEPEPEPEEEPEPEDVEDEILPPGSKRDIELDCAYKEGTAADGKTLHMAMQIPGEWRREKGSHTLYRREDGTKVMEIMHVIPKAGSKSLWSASKVWKMPGYKSAETDVIQGLETLISIHDLPAEEAVTPDGKLLYAYQYDFPHGDDFVRIRFYEVGDNNTEAKAVHKKILESITF